MIHTEGRFTFDDQTGQITVPKGYIETEAFQASFDKIQAGESVVITMAGREFRLASRWSLPFRPTSQPGSGSRSWRSVREPATFNSCKGRRLRCSTT